MNAMPGTAPKRVPIGGVDVVAAGHAAVEAPELGHAQRGQEVAQAVIETEVDVLVVRLGLAGLGGEMPGPLDQLLVGATRASRRRWW